MDMFKIKSVYYEKGMTLCLPSYKRRAKKALRKGRVYRIDFWPNHSDQTVVASLTNLVFVKLNNMPEICEAYDVGVIYRMPSGRFIGIKIIEQEFYEHACLVDLGFDEPAIKYIDGEEYLKEEL